MKNINNLMMIFKGITEQQNDMQTLLDDTLKETLLAYKEVFGTNTIIFEGIERPEVLFGGINSNSIWSSYILQVYFNDEGVLLRATIGADDIKCTHTFLFDVDDIYAEPNVLLMWKENLLSMILNKLGKQELGKGVADYLVEK